jgi:uncharacterized protein YegJ (DUF2314 family)
MKSMALGSSQVVNKLPTSYGTHGVRQMNCLAPEDGTDWMFRNVGKLPTHSTLQARSAKVPLERGGSLKARISHQMFLL